MKIRYYIDPQTGEPHIGKHNVVESEVESVLLMPGEDRRGRNDTRVAIGATSSGRLLRVIYVPDREDDGMFVITAYEIKGKPAFAIRRRKRKKQS